MALSFSLESYVLLAVGPFKEILSVSGTPSLKKYVSEQSVSLEIIHPFQTCKY